MQASTRKHRKYQSYTLIKKTLFNVHSFSGVYEYLLRRIACIAQMRPIAVYGVALGLSRCVYVTTRDRKFYKTAKPIEMPLTAGPRNNVLYAGAH